jgi:hypothetical protein
VPFSASSTSARHAASPAGAKPFAKEISAMFLNL